MSANKIPHAMYPRSKPPTIRYYGFSSLPTIKYGVNLGGPPLLTDVILHDFLPLDLAPIHPAPSVYNLGLFSKLPDELLYLHILEELDLLSLIRFRNTSRHAHYVVDTIPEFQILVKWAPQVIRGCTCCTNECRGQRGNDRRQTSTKTLRSMRQGSSAHLASNIKPPMFSMRAQRTNAARGRRDAQALQPNQK